MTEEPVSTWTGLAYPVAAAVALSMGQSVELGVFALFMVVLGVGTFAFHDRWTRATADLDHAGMVAVLVALATGAVGGPAWLMFAGGLGAAIGLVYWRDAYSHALIGVLLYFALIGVGLSAPALTLFAVLMMGLGFWVWHRGGDRAHAWWHVSTALGLSVLALAVL